MRAILGRGLFNAAWAAAICGGLFAVGCQSRDNGAASKSDSASKTDSAAVAGAKTSPGSVGDEALPKMPGCPTITAAEPAAVDPLKDGWETEAYYELAKAQLKLVGKLISHPDEIDAAHVGNLAAANFTCGPLRPANLAEVFRDPSLKVLRQSGEAAAPAAGGPAGSEALAAALRGLCEPLRDKKNIRVAHKLFRVEAKGEVTTTKAYYQGYGESPAGNIQQNSTWTCDWVRPKPDAPPQLVSIQVEAYEEVLAAAPGAERQAGRLFADCTAAVLQGNSSFADQLLRGTDHWLNQIEQKLGVEVGGWYGVSVGDVNGDGLDDLYVCQQGQLPNRLFVQQPDGTARDVSAEAGVDFLDPSLASLIVDFDNDGDQDLAVATGAGIAILANDGAGKFQIVATKIMPDSAPHSLAAADFDHDGDLDLFVCGYRKRKDASQDAAWARPIPYHDANNGGRNVFFRNDGGWKFLDVTQKVGLGQNNTRFSYAAAWEDFDNDGDQDLYVANDFGRNNLYRNDGGKFTDVAATAGVEDISAGMSVSWGDYNQDGKMDLYVSNMFSSAGNRVAYQRQFKSGLDERTKGEFQRHSRGNSLFENVGDGGFRDVSVPANVTFSRWAWASLFTDINNDGLEDLYVANGFVTQDATKDL